jgi:pyrimidine-specific ribonucleoside hydrolase
MIRLVKNISWGLLLFIMLEAQAIAHDVSLSAIVDTDMALDDIRAVTMLLNSEGIKVPLFVASDGVRSPQEGAMNLKAILKYFGRDNIEVIEGKGLDRALPEFRKLIGEIKVPGSNDLSSRDPFKNISAPEEVVRTINSMEEPVLYLCLGPLTNLAEALRIDPGIKEGISFLIYFGAHPDDEYPGWNSQRDPDAARSVFSAGLRIYSMALPEENLLDFDQGLYEDMKELGTPSSSLLEQIHESPDIMALLNQRHFSVWDEMIAVYINNPSLFTFSLSSRHGKVMSLTEIDIEGMREAYLQALGYSADVHLSTRHAVILSAFPKDPELFRDDVSPYVDEIIERHGMEEWKACLLTNEFHRHLGIYSLIGAKMGVRAREILEAQFDSLELISRVGNSPPLSCMNDGLQVSTGASLGRGTISISDGQSLPEAIFIHNDTSLKLTLKNEVWERVKKEISELVNKHGGLSPSYFSDVRKLSIQYWRELDRNEIFDESVSQ